MVVFDMDGVLCRYRIERRLARLASWSGRTPETIRAAIWGSGFEDEAERGMLSAPQNQQSTLSLVGALSLCIRPGMEAVGPQNTHSN
jgi:hypothetical protein